MTTQEQLNDFYEFASKQVVHGVDDISLDDLYRVWRCRIPTDSELTESVAAVKSAFADHKAGDEGRPARSTLRAACDELGLVIDE